MSKSSTFFPNELLPDSEAISSIRKMRASGGWHIDDIAHYNRVSVTAVHLLSDDLATEGETALEKILTEI